MRSVLFLVAALVTASAVPGPAHGAGFSEMTPVANWTLDRMRGGFMSDGLEIAFGIERVTFVNGNLVALDQVVPNGTLVTGNASAVPGLPQSASALTTVIRNSLDNQVIKHFNLVNVRVTGTELTRSLMVQGAVRDALVRTSR